MTRSLTSFLALIAFASTLVVPAAADAWPYGYSRGYSRSYCPSPGYRYSHGYKYRQYNSHSYRHRSHHKPYYRYSRSGFHGHFSHGSHGSRYGVGIHYSFSRRDTHHKPAYTHLRTAKDYPDRAHVVPKVARAEPGHATDALSDSPRSAVASTERVTRTYHPRPVSLDDGFHLLAAGEVSPALSFFSARASRHPRDARPKVGYALAVAMHEDHSRSTWAMRRAFRVDPSSLSEIHLPAALAQPLEELTEHFEHRAGRGDDDARFMVAALSYLAGDDYRAMDAIDRVLASGNADSSDYHLKRLLDDRADSTRHAEKD